MKQHPKSRNCIAVCAAMAVGSDLRELHRTIGKKDEYSDLDIYQYLMAHGYYPGALFQVEHDKVKKNSSFKIKVSPEDGPALVYVKSERSKHDLHAIYWDGEKIYDPNPFVKHGRPLSDYSIEDWVPIRKAQRNGCVNSEEYEVISTHKKKKKKKGRKKGVRRCSD